MKPVHPSNFENPLGVEMCKNRGVRGIVACDPRGVIGLEGKLPWHYPEDLQFFSETIQKFPIVMGRKTWETLPRKYFVDRAVVVFSHEKRQGVHGEIWVTSLEEFLLLDLSSPTFLIGGGELYSLFLENQIVRDFFISHIKKEYAGDTFFPLSLLETWTKTVLRDTQKITTCYYENHHSQNTKNISL
ncbi:Dihydrofolate reductase 2 [Chlamydia pneumoniae]|uniref:Dihydrofolate reductase n=3 Tax=Chlamydia pneumoniae TaxID=83558 RepID=A0A0F7YVQ6_CHLPN|nr:Dihydrofolate reductase 2 [Chlamydia pneumoniae]CRI36141.1 Dihydrofolate reductase 2 [Chlamydia pneumoniae]CRI37268.1 Dihydrofolate reductase 2 [Chlamydia pneumoniae]CRI38396.1 Dihydrofolate reductase 2 [Chlamydia pneumoniae]CRI39528.1 Dihydrofolate reductase 2 [Chlamydia pneumoniae]